jgi:broad specificity phosphatase PhoE
LSCSASSSPPPSAKELAEAYPLVWAGDEINPDNDEKGVESPYQVMARVTALVCEYEEKISGETMLLISHNDILGYGCFNPLTPVLYFLFRNSVFIHWRG